LNKAPRVWRQEFTDSSSPGGRRRPVRGLLIGALFVLAPVLPLATAGERVPVEVKEVFTADDARKLTDWALRQGVVRAAVGTSRVRALGMGVAAGKGSEGPALVLYLRHYDSGRVQRVTIDPSTGEVAVRDLPGAIQPTPDEIADARGIVSRDAALASLLADRALSLQGGFLTRSSEPSHPCARSVCVEFAFARAGYPKGPHRRVIVDLSRGVVAERDFRPRSAQTEKSR
jgi:hypothetical protein